MNRRDWLTKTSIALAGGLILGDAVMEQYERLTHKKVWALGGVGDPIVSHNVARYLEIFVDGRWVRVLRSRKLIPGRVYMPESMVMAYINGETSMFRVPT